MCHDCVMSLAESSERRTNEVYIWRLYGGTGFGLENNAKYSVKLTDSRLECVLPESRSSVPFYVECVALF